MTDKIAILYPSIVMALMTLALILAMGMRRLAAIRKHQLSIKYYRTYSDGPGEPESLRQHSRHVQNHFEVPPLFHLAVWGSFLAGEVGSLAMGAAWFFVATRGLHTVIHLSYNNVTHRFLVYGMGVLTVLFLWVQLLLALMR
jgi:hypothetical protein